jgi:hypothetical protein
LGEGGPALNESPVITASAKADFAGRSQDVLKGFSSITYIVAEDVTGRASSGMEDR